MTARGLIPAGHKVATRDIAAGAQTLDPIVDLSERGEDEYRRFLPLFAQAPDQRKPIEFRQHADRKSVV